MNDGVWEKNKVVPRSDMTDGGGYRELEGQE